MTIHFTEQELAERRQRACAAMTEQGLDALLIYRQESMYYLTGYDTFGYVWYQCLVLTADGGMTLLTRSADLRQARHTAVIDDIRIWEDLPEADPSAEDLTDILREKGLEGGRLGVEWLAYGLVGRDALRLAAAMQGFATLEDASYLVSRLRVVKSEAEIAYVRRAAELADAAWDEAVRLAAPGAWEGDILAAMHGAVYRGGGDDPANEFVIGSGHDALLCRYHSGRRRLDPQDQLTLEWAGVERHYHVAMMRTIPIGPIPERQRMMYDAAFEALEAVKDALKPGGTFGDGFAAHAQVLDRLGLQQHRLNACGYSLGTTFGPNWMDWPMLYRDNPVEVVAGMTIFCHMIIFDSEQSLAMTLGETILTTETGHERLSSHPLDLVAK